MLYNFSSQPQSMTLTAAERSDERREEQHDPHSVTPPSVRCIRVGAADEVGGAVGAAVFMEGVAMRHDLLNSVPQLRRGMCWCVSCGRSEQVDSGDCLRNGWPKCCGHTMTIDSPEERRIQAQRKEEK